MSTIIEEYKHRFENEIISGTVKWISHKGWEEKKPLKEMLNKITDEQFNSLSIRQRLIMELTKRSYTSVLDQKDLPIDLSKLNEEEINELIVFYRLQKPEKRFDEIKRDINSPESFMTSIPYSVICELHRRGIVPYDRQIFTACMVRFNVWHAASYSKELKPEARERFDSVFPQDDFALDNLMGVFEMELGVDGAFYLERDFNIGAVIIELVKRNKIKRDVIQQKLFDAFNNPTLKQTTHGWAKNIYRDLEFAVDENIKCQDQLIELLHNDRNLLANFGIQELKKITGHNSFNWDLFIDSLDGIVYREKLAGAIKTAVTILLKQLKKDKGLLKKTCINLAPLFLQDDAKIQSAAVQCFALLNGYDEEIEEAILPYVDTMHAEVKSGLSNFLGEAATVEELAEEYQQVEYIPEPCTEKRKISCIDNEDDFIFLVSKVLKSEAAIDYELFLEALPRFQSIKEKHKNTLQPALKQAKKLSTEQYLDITARKGMHHYVAAQLICIWLDPKYPSIPEQIKTWNDLMKKEKRYEYTGTRWIAIYKNFSRIRFIAEQFENENILPLLSSPTHQNFEIDPNIFLERLTEYEKEGAKPDEGDFCIALSRLNRWTPVSKKLLSNNPTSEYRKIINYLFDEKEVFDTKNINQLRNGWQTTFMLKNPGKEIDTIVAERDKKEWGTKETWDWWFGEQKSENYSWTIVETSFQKTQGWVYGDGCATYQEHLFFNEYMIADTDHWFSRYGFLTEPLYLNFVLKAFHYLSDLEADQTKAVMQAVKCSVQNPKPLGKAGYFFLTLSLFCSNKPIRNAALDWLLLLIEKQYLNIAEFTAAITKALASDTHPVPMNRVSEQFSQLLQMRGVYVDVLQKVIEQALVAMNPENLPKSFSKIIHFYYETLQLIAKPLPEEIKKALEAMKSVNTVKKEVLKVLGKGV